MAPMADTADGTIKVQSPGDYLSRDLLKFNSVNKGVHLPKKQCHRPSVQKKSQPCPSLMPQCFLRTAAVPYPMTKTPDRLTSRCYLGSRCEHTCLSVCHDGEELALAGRSVFILRKQRQMNFCSAHCFLCCPEPQSMGKCSPLLGRVFLLQ